MITHKQEDLFMNRKKEYNMNEIQRQKVKDFEFEQTQYEAELSKQSKYELEVSKLLEELQHSDNYDYIGLLDTYAYNNTVLEKAAIMEEIEQMEKETSSLEYDKEPTFDSDPDLVDNSFICELFSKSRSRFRHHNDEKAKKRAQLSAEYVRSKFLQLSEKATLEEYFRMYAKVSSANKKAARFK